MNNPRYMELEKKVFDATKIYLDRIDLPIERIASV
jgi:hypothetical protein